MGPSGDRLPDDRTPPRGGLGARFPGEPRATRPEDPDLEPLRRPERGADRALWITVLAVGALAVLIVIVWSGFTVTVGPSTASQRRRARMENQTRLIVFRAAVSMQPSRERLVASLRAGADGDTNRSSEALCAVIHAPDSPCHIDQSETYTADCDHDGADEFVDAAGNPVAVLLCDPDAARAGRDVLRLRSGATAEVSGQDVARRFGRSGLAIVSLGADGAFGTEDDDVEWIQGEGT